MNRTDITVNWTLSAEVKKFLANSSGGFCGLYMITGESDNGRTLLYLGKSWGDRIPIRPSIDSHRREWLSNYPGKKKVHLGEVIIPARAPFSYTEDAERALLYATRPIQNTNIPPSYDPPHFLVLQNIGGFYMLPPTIVNGVPSAKRLP